MLKSNTELAHVRNACYRANLNNALYGTIVRPFFELVSHRKRII